MHEGWSVFRSGGGSTPSEAAPPIGAPLAATIPGVVHQDLIEAGLIPHPDLMDGEARQAWVGRCDWTWSRSTGRADLPAGVGVDSVVELVFDSIDTVGEVWLGPRRLGPVENQFQRHRFRIDGAGIEHGEAIEVRLRSPLVELERLVGLHGDRPVNADGEWGVYSYLRKASCSFGWDWGPKCPSLGMPGGVRIECWRDARLEAVRPGVRMLDDGTAVVEVRLDLAFDAGTRGEGGLRADVVIGAPDGRSFTGRVDFPPGHESTTGVARIEVPDPMCWWPRGRGPQHLHELRVELHRGEVRLDVATRRIGLRSVDLDTDLDSEGSRFEVVVNGESVYCMGANWIPDGLFPGTASDARTRERIEQAVEAGFNMLRVWGGGTYESDAFYEACDELGVMVWQDFMFACATYPEEGPYPASIEAEARHQVSRLCGHSSIVLWCGGNENVLAWRNWGWKERMDRNQSWGSRYFTELLPAVVDELDPSRPYLPDSPWSGSVEHDPNDPGHGDRHTWDFKVDAFRDHVPRFVSEFGHQAPPGRRSIEAAIGTDSLSSESDSAMEAFAGRQRGWGGDAEQYDRWLDDWFTPATDLDGRLWRMQLLQARATSIAFEWARFNQPRCKGALIWQLNDAWTGHSWSLIDVHGHPKPAWWAARAACRPKLCGFSPAQAGVELVFANGTRDEWAAEATVRRLAMSGDELACETIKVGIAGDETIHVPLPSTLGVVGEPSSEFLIVELERTRACWFHGKDASLSLPPPVVDLEIERYSTEARIHLRSRTLIRDLHLDVSRLSTDARTTENLITMLPGEEQVLTLTGVGGISIETMREAIRAPGFLASANDCSGGARDQERPD